MTRRSLALAACLLLGTAPGPSWAQVSPAEREQLLALHDAERCAVDPAAASMPAMAWDDRLAAVAQAYAASCVWAHNANRTAQYTAQGGSGYVGENLARGTAGFFSIADLAQLWANEKDDWSYGALGSANFSGVGHYTQMIWAGTLAVGCGAAACGGDTFLVCDYSPGGNHLGQPPYVAGAGTNDACGLPVPEPGTALGLVAALAALAVRRATAGRGARRACPRDRDR